MSVGSVKKVDGVCVTRCPADLPERETERGRIAPTKMVVPAGGRGAQGSGASLWLVERASVEPFDGAAGGRGWNVPWPGSLPRLLRIRPLAGRPPPLPRVISWVAEDGRGLVGSAS